jgi:hypothetical protein
MNRVRFLKDHAGHSKGDVVELRSKEAREAVKAEAVVILEDIDPKAFQTKVVTASKPKAPKPASATTTTARSTQNNHQTNGSSDGNTQNVRTHNSSGR